MTLVKQKRGETDGVQPNHPKLGNWKLSQLIVFTRTKEVEPNRGLQITTFGKILTVIRVCIFLCAIVCIEFKMQEQLQ